MASDIQKLLAIIEQQLDWGSADAWQSRDFENLNQLIFDKTKVSLSESTLRRVWGRVTYNHLPSTTTLDTLAQFAGFDSWRAFCKPRPGKGTRLETVPKQDVKNDKASKAVKIITVIIGPLLIILLAVYLLNASHNKLNSADYKFSSERLTSAIPNSVIFNYDATASPTDSVYIQQSWDPRTRTLVSKNAHTHTSVYYEPGFYQAKLLIGDKTIKKHKLMIPSAGWLGLIEDKPVPVYLNQQDFLQKDMLNLPVETIRQKNISMQPKPTLIRYYNVGNFKPVPVNNFSFSCELKNGYKDGEAACEFASASLITDSGPIIIPLSVKGCVSELTLFSVDWIISGKKANLSGFGVDLSDWVKVSCKSTSKTIRYFVNDRQVFEFQLPSPDVKIVGMGFSFQGTGAVKGIELKEGEKLVFGAF